MVPLSKDYTAADFVGRERYDRFKQTSLHKKTGELVGLSINKTAIGYFIDSQVGLGFLTSSITRGLSLVIHFATSSKYTEYREGIYREGNITPERHRFWREGAEYLGHSTFQTGAYMLQVGLAMLCDPTVDFELAKVSEGALTFVQHSLWVAPAARWSMNWFRRFFEIPLPEQMALEDRVAEE
jgi:hypothetical protein